MFPNVQLHNAVLNLFTDYLPLPCFLIPRQGDSLTWYTLAPAEPRTHPMQFELYFNRAQERRAYNQRLFERAAALRRPVLGSHAGMQDLVQPVLRKGKVEAFIQVGSFLSSLPTRQALWLQWGRLRRKPMPSDAQDFLFYVRTLLQTPVLQPAALQALKRVLAALAQALADESAQPQALRVLQQHKPLLARLCPWRMAHYAQARRDKWNQGPLQGAELAPWDREEFSLPRSPDTAIALRLRRQPEDEVEALCQVARLQQACFEYCSQQGGLVAGRLENEAALILSAQKAQTIKPLAQNLRRHLEARLRVDLVAVYASAPPENLDQAIAQAETALKAALHWDRPLVAAAEISAPPLQSLPALAQQLAEDLARAAFARPAAGHFFSQAWRQSGGSLELLRAHLTWCLRHLEQRLARRASLAAAALQALSHQAQAALATARSSRELAARFESAVEQWCQALQRPAQAERRQRLQQALDLLKQQAGESASLKHLAAESGFSMSHLSRLLKKEAGFGFAQARQQWRLEKARQLLQGSALRVADIALECGFSSASHLVRAFQAAEGLSPAKYRKKALQ